MADSPIRKLEEEELKLLVTRGEHDCEDVPKRSIEESLELAAEWRRTLGLKSTDSADAQREDRSR